MADGELTAADAFAHSNLVEKARNQVHKSWRRARHMGFYLVEPFSESRCDLQMSIFKSI